MKARECKTCAKSLDGRRADARFCSVTCRSRASRALKRDPVAVALSVASVASHATLSAENATLSAARGSRCVSFNKSTRTVPSVLPVSVAVTATLSATLSEIRDTLEAILAAVERTDGTGRNFSDFSESDTVKAPKADASEAVRQLWDMLTADGHPPKQWAAIEKKVADLKLSADDLEVTAKKAESERTKGGNGLLISRLLRGCIERADELPEGFEIDPDRLEVFKDGVRQDSETSWLRDGRTTISALTYYLRHDRWPA